MSKSSFYRKWRRFLDALEAGNPEERSEEPVFYQESVALQDKILSKKIIPKGRL